MAPGAAAHAACTDMLIDAAPLDRALLSLAQQTGADIASTEADLRKVRASRIKGCLTVDEALRRLTRGTGYRAVAIDGRSYRIVRAPMIVERKPALPLPAERTEEGNEQIVVTGAKQQMTLLRFPGSVQIVDIDPPKGAARNISIDELADRTPIIQKTELGIGRNKLFIRGIADSSFNGPTQSTATIYFDDVQLNYAGPEPALHLYDMAKVEILEGPQETLYGAGAISGIVRLTPMQANLTSLDASGVVGVTAIKGGETGYDASAMLNLPVLRDRVGLRVVAYRIRDGGYVDDQQRLLNNVNRTETLGGRASLRIEPGDGWSIDTGVLGQKIDAADSNYAEVMVGPLARRSALAQPYSSNIWLARAVIRKRWASGLELVSATGVVHTEASDTFDATRAFGATVPIIYQNDNDGLLLSQETRLSRTTAGGTSWVAGAAFLYDRDAQNRVIGQVAMPIEIIGVTNITRSASAFGEITVPVLRNLAITVGVRGTIARTEGEPSITPREAPSERGLLLQRVEPALSASWLLAPRLAAFVRFQSGYRTGGIAVARGIGRIANFRSDSIRVGEIGIRMERAGTRGLAFSTALSVARWRDIQADLFSRRSQPYTDNIGDADIVALESTGDWVPLDGLRIGFAAFWTRNRTHGELAVTSQAHNRHLPDTPPFSGNLDVDYTRELGNGQRFEISASAYYMGRSVLGQGSFLDLSQGDYMTLRLGGAWRWKHVEASIDIDNLTNESRSKFAMGNPLAFGFREQTVPLRPRSVRFGIGVRW